MPLPKPRSNWGAGDFDVLYKNWQSTMMTLSEKTPILSEKYRQCLQRGREAIIDKMIELIVNETFVKKQTFANWYSLYWKDAPHFMAKFLQQLETVFIGDNEIKIRKKMLVPAVGVATSAVGTVPVPKPTKDWNETDINILYKECESAMSLLEKNPAIISEKYKQCLQKGRDVIMKIMMKFIMDPENFPKDSTCSEYLVGWQRAPEALATILHRSETVFIVDQELQIREKRIVVTRNKTITIPPRASLVALVEAPEARQKCGILRAYGEMKSFSASNKFHLEVLQGKRILNEKWAEEGETYNLTGEANAMLCMHLWSLMRYVGFSKSEKIWESISRGWPECVTWKQGCHGTFWEIIHSEKVPLWVEAKNKGLDTVLDAYKDMERHFKDDGEHCLKHYEDAYYPKEHNPYRS